MPSEYELGTDPGDKQSIAVGEFALADGTVSLILPKHWVLRREDFRSAHFAIPELQDATLTVEVEIFDNPAAIAANDLLDYVSHPAFPPLADDALDHVRDGNGKPDFEKLTVRARGTTRGPDGTGDDHEAVRIWRKLGLHRPNSIRVLEAQLSVAEEEAGSGAAQEAEDIIDHLLKFARFADHETAADRIAPSVTLKSVIFWNTIHMRLPAESRGRYVGEKADEAYLCDHENDGRWHVRISRSMFDVGDKVFDLQWLIEENEKRVRPPRDTELIASTCERVRDRADEVLATMVLRRIEDGEQCHCVMWRKAVRQGETLLLAHVTLSIIETQHAKPEMRALAATFEREVHNAVLFLGNPEERDAEDATDADGDASGGGHERLYDSETETAYKLQVLTLGDGAATVYLPHDWTIFKQDFSSARLNVPWVDGAHVSVDLKSYEDPESIRTNDLERYLAGQLPPQEYGPEDRDEGGLIDFEKFTRRADGYALPDNMPNDTALEFREAFWLWRRIGLLRPNHIRTVEVHLYIPAAEAKSARAEEARSVLAGLVSQVTFADHETSADRVALSRALNRVWLWDTICLRVPVDWPDAERENDDGTGMYAFDDRPAGRWTFSVDYDAYRYGDGGAPLDAAAAAAKMASGAKEDWSNLLEATHDPLTDRPGEALAKVVYGSHEDGKVLRHISWHKIVVRGAVIMLGHFTLVVEEAIAGDPDIMALAALLERECRNAVLVDRDADALRRPPARNA